MKFIYKQLSHHYSIYNLLLALSFFSLFSCSDKDLPQFNQLNKLRVIALTTPTPEVNPGTTVTITPVVSDVNSTGAADLSDSVQACIDVGVSYGVTPTCEGNPSKVVIHSNRTLTAPGVTDQWTGSADTFSVTVPTAGVIFYGRSSSDQFNGINYLIEYTLKNAAGKELKSFRRIVVSESSKTAKNQNPAITDIYANGVSMSAVPYGSSTTLTSDLSSVSFESYVYKNSDGVGQSFSENLSVTWMITDGETKYFRTDAGTGTEYTPPSSAPTGRSAYIFAVARDNRGGVTVVRKKF